jgi:hypothetical protein
MHLQSVLECYCNETLPLANMTTPDIHSAAHLPIGIVTNETTIFSVSFLFP